MAKYDPTDALLVVLRNDRDHRAAIDALIEEYPDGSDARYAIKEYLDAW